MNDKKTDDILEPFQEDFKMLLEAGFMAVQQQDEPNARKLFHAAGALRPEHSAPKVGLGYIALNKLQLKEAEEVFEDILKVDPENQLARAFLGIAYLLSEPKRGDGEKLVKEAMKKTDDQTIVTLCQTSLDWADKDLKRTAAPFFAQEKEQADEKQGAESKKE